VEYYILEGETLFYMEATGMEDVGCLWEPGQTNPLYHETQQKVSSLLAKGGSLRKGDPSSAKPPKRGPPRPRAKAHPQPPKRREADEVGLAAADDGTNDGAGVSTTEGTDEPSVDPDVTVCGGGVVLDVGGGGAAIVSINEDDLMDCADAEPSLQGDGLDEYFLSDGEVGGGAEDPDGDGDGKVTSDPTPPEGDVFTMIEHIAAKCVGVADQVDLADPGNENGDGPPEPPGDGHGDPGVGEEPREPAPATPPPAPPVPVSLYDRLGPPDKDGYVKEDARIRLRIQRKAGRLWVNCSRHTSCRLNVPETNGPSDPELYDWCWSVPSIQYTDPSDVKKAAAKNHMASGRAKWGQRKRDKLGPARPQLGGFLCFERISVYTALLCYAKPRARNLAHVIVSFVLVKSSHIGLTLSTLC
jgi:hypothetical protein